MKRSGIDPGSGHMAVTIIDGSRPPTAEEWDRLRALPPDERIALARELDVLHLVTDPRTFEVGRLIARDRPKETASGAILTHRRVLDDDDVQRVAIELRDHLLEHGVERAAIEWIDSAHMGDETDPAAMRGIASGLTKTMWVAAVLSEKLLAAGIQVVRPLRPTWVRSVTRHEVGGRGVEIGIAMGSLVVGWAEYEKRRPPRSQSHDRGLEHQRDSAGCAVWDVLPPPPKRKAPSGATRAPRKPPVERPHVPEPVFTEMKVLAGESPDLLAQLARMPRRGRAGAPRRRAASEERKREEAQARRDAGERRGRPGFKPEG